MTKLDFEAKRAIVRMRSNRETCSAIAQKLKSDYGIEVTRQAICEFLLIYNRTKSLTQRQGSGRSSKISADCMRIIEAKMQSDDETTATQLLEILRRSGMQICLATVKNCRAKMGWTFHGTRYCQMIRDANKIKRLQFANECLANRETFDDVIWTDETSVQLESHRRHCFRKKSENQNSSLGPSIH